MGTILITEDGEASYRLWSFPDQTAALLVKIIPFTDQRGEAGQGRKLSKYFCLHFAVSSLVSWQGGVEEQNEVAATVT